MPTRQLWAPVMHTCQLQCGSDLGVEVQEWVSAWVCTKQVCQCEGLQEGLMQFSRVARQSMDSARNEGFDHGFAKGYGKGMLDGVKEMTKGNDKQK